MIFCAVPNVVAPPAVFISAVGVKRPGSTVESPVRLSTEIVDTGLPASVTTTRRGSKLFPNCKAFA